MTAPQLPPPPGPPPPIGAASARPQPRRGRTVAAALGVLALMATTAAVTYALTSSSTPSVEGDTAAAQTTTAAPEASSATAAAAKDKLCGVFDVTTRNSKGAGGYRITPDEPNLPIVVRALGRVVELQRAAANPALAEDLSAAAESYLDTNLRLANTALSSAPASEVNDLTRKSNDAAAVLIRMCGL